MFRPDDQNVILLSLQPGCNSQNTYFHLQAPSSNKTYMICRYNSTLLPICQVHFIFFSGFNHFSMPCHLSRFIFQTPYCSEPTLLNPIVFRNPVTCPDSFFKPHTAPNPPPESDRFSKTICSAASRNRCRKKIRPQPTAAKHARS